MRRDGGDEGLGPVLGLHSAKPLSNTAQAPRQHWYPSTVVRDTLLRVLH